jgi:hypothetical protein
MYQDENLSDDPIEIVRYLIKENGLDRARQIAMEGTTTANEEGNFYRLSIWREVKHFLRDWQEVLEEEGDEAPEQEESPEQIAG